MLVKELYKGIDFDDLSDKAEESDYWASCCQFVSDHWQNDIDDLSQKQLDWLDKIEMDL